MIHVCDNFFPDPFEIRKINYVQSSDLGKTEDPVIPFDSCDFDKTTNMTLLNSSFEDFEKRQKKRSTI